MKELTKVKCGWKWLETQLNILISAINARTIIVPTGGGIDFLQTDTGMLIALSSSGVLAKAGSSTSTTTAGGDDAASVFPLGGMDRQGVSQLLFRLAHAPNGEPNLSCSINVVDASTGTCITKTIFYWGTPPA